MRTTKILTVALMLATLVAGCNKDKDKHIRIFAEGMSAGDSKVQINPGNIPAGAQWVEGESIIIDGTPHTISQDGDYYFVDNFDEQNATLYAMYPGNGFDGNDVTVNFNSHEIVLNSLTVRMLDGGLQRMAFPMAGRYEANATNINFYHLTAGLRLTLENNTTSAKNVASLKVVAQSNQTSGSIDNLSFDGRRNSEDESWGSTFTARWAVQGPTVPTGNVGSNGDVVDAKFASEMNFNLKSGNNDYVTIDDDDDVSFCIPVTITSISKLAVTGYAQDGTEMFHVVKDFGSNKPVERNRMYTVPVITINN